MSKLPLISVVVPSHNRPDAIVRCLDALAAQRDAPPFEVVVIDDGSSEATTQAIADFRARHPELALTALRNPKQIGANPSRNRGIAASRGSLIAFEDDDCEAEPQWLAELAKGFVSERVGAVTGIVLDPAPRNIYDLAFRGTHRVYGDVHATRLVAGNMCVRRELLHGKLDEDRAQVSSDLSVSGRGDEEDLFLKLRAEGWEMRIAHEARVLHVHYYTRRSFYRQALRGGGATAKLGYKYHLPPRIELLCLVFGHGFLWLTPIQPLCLIPAALCFGAFTAGALIYNEIWRKNKTVFEAIRTAPVMTAYYHVRAFGYVRQYLACLLGREPIARVRLDAAAAKSAAPRAAPSAPSNGRGGTAAQS